MSSVEPDYYPLRPGLALEYAVKTAEGAGSLRVEVLSVERRGGESVARCRRTSRWGGETRTGEFTARRDGRGVSREGELELPLPPRLGARWTRDPNDFSIDALDAVTTVPAGTFRDCLLVSWRVAGGDGGQGERFYAPGVGLVRENCLEESRTYEHALTRIL